MYKDNRSKPFYGIPVALLLITTLAAFGRPAAAADDEEALVPRDRLVTDSELFALIDLSSQELTGIRQGLAAGDTARALTELGVYFSTRTSPSYFFSTDEIPERIEYLRQAYPDEVERIRRESELFIRTYGTDVDWIMPGANLQGEPHTPNVIRFLARQWHAEDIARLHHLSGDDTYLEFLRAHIRDFVNDYEAGRAQAGANDVFERFYAGHRTRNWVLMHHLLSASPSYTPEDHVYMLRVFILHGARLYDQSRRFNWGNHQLHGLAGLFEMTAMYPELPVMHVWREQALNLLAEHLEREIREDGFQFERASHYHLLDILNYFRVYQIASLNGISLPDFYEGRFRKMFDAVVALAMPDGDLPIIQDVSAPFHHRTDPVATEMSIGAVLFNDPSYRFFATDQLPASLYWFFPHEQVLKYANLQGQEPDVGSVALDESKYYVMRTGWGEDDLYLLIDAGLAEHKPDHTQGGVLGIIAYGFGDQFLPNYPVMYRHQSYKTLKNSLVKSVALVDRVMQGRGWIDNKSRTGFGIWAELPEPTVHEWISGDTFDYFRGSHDGFEHIGVEYERSIFFFKPDFWVVFDEFSGSRSHSYQQIWQGAYEIRGNDYGSDRVRPDGDISYFSPDEPPANRAVQLGEHSRLSVYQADPEPMNITNLRNYFYDAVEFEKEGGTHYRFSTLLKPGSAGGESDARFAHYVRPGEFEEVIVREGSSEDYLYFGSEDGIEVELIQSDAGMAALRFEHTELYSAMMHAGTRIETAEFSLAFDNPVTIELRRSADDEWELNVLRGAPQQLSVHTLHETTEMDVEPGNTYVLTARVTN